MTCASYVSPRECDLSCFAQSTLDIILATKLKAIDDQSCIEELPKPCREAFHGGSQMSILRIDNSRRDKIHSLWNISRITKATTSCDISNEMADLSACVDISGL